MTEPRNCFFCSSGWVVGKVANRIGVEVDVCATHKLSAMAVGWTEVKEPPIWKRISKWLKEQHEARKS